LISEVVQVEVGLSAYYDIYEYGKRMGSVCCPCNTCYTGILHVNLLHNIGLNLRYTQPHITPRKRVPPYILTDKYGMGLGSIRALDNKPYKACGKRAIMRIQNTTLTAEHIGLGKEGLKVILYDKDEQVALIEGLCNTKKSAYVIYTIDSEYHFYAQLYAIYLCICKFHAKTHKALAWSWKRSDRLKYNPMFKREVLALARSISP